MVDTAEIQPESQLYAGDKVAPGDSSRPMMGSNLKTVGAKTRKTPVQLTWEDIVITAMPPTGRCKPKNALKEPKEIIRGVSGTVEPGQFLAIIGASGKLKTFNMPI